MRKWKRKIDTQLWERVVMGASGGDNENGRYYNLDNMKQKREYNVGDSSTTHMPRKRRKHE